MWLGCKRNLKCFGAINIVTHVKTKGEENKNGIAQGQIMLWEYLKGCKGNWNLAFVFYYYFFFLGLMVR